MEPTRAPRRIALWDVDPACVFVPDYHEIERRIARDAPRTPLVLWLIGAALAAATLATTRVRARTRRAVAGARRRCQGDGKVGTERDVPDGA